MAFSKVGLAIFAIWLVAVQHSGKVEGQDCTRDFAALTATCRQYVERDQPPAAPSSECCQTVRSANLVCACSRVTPDVERMISMTKVVEVAKTCGHPIPSGTKCGSFTVPRV